MNSDGFSDLIVKDDFDGGIDTYINTATGNGSFYALTALTNNSPPWGDGVYRLPETYRTFRTADFNGDGSDDLLIRHPDEGFVIAYAKFLDGEGWSFGDPAGIQYGGGHVYSNANGWDLPEYYSTTRTPDLNADGLADVVIIGPSGLNVHLNNGSGGWLTTEGAVPLIGSQYGAESVYGTLLFADVMPNTGCSVGCPELIIREQCGLSIWERIVSTGAWVQQRTPDCSDRMELRDSGYDGVLGTADDWTAVSRWGSLQQGNLNGDSCADLFARDHPHARVLLSDCGGDLVLEPDAQIRTNDTIVAVPTDIPGWDDPGVARSLQLGDVNGDGLDDVVGRGTSGIVTWLNTGTGTFSPADAHHPRWSDFQFASGVPLSLWTWGAPGRVVMLADLDGAAAPGVQLLGRDAGSCMISHDFVP